MAECRKDGVDCPDFYKCTEEGDIVQNSGKKLQRFCFYCLATQEELQELHVEGRDQVGQHEADAERRHVAQRGHAPASAGPPVAQAPQQHGPHGHGQ